MCFGRPQFLYLEAVGAVEADDEEHGRAKPSSSKRGGASNNSSDGKKKGKKRGGKEIHVPLRAGAPSRRVPPPERDSA